MRSRLEITVFPPFHSKLISGTTFGGNPLATRLAHHVFGRLSAPEMLSQIASTSSVFQSQINKFQESLPNLVDSVRGRGLILGIQLKSTADKSASDIANLIVTSAREKGLLIITAGEGTIRLVPPLNIPEDAVSQGLAILEEAMRDVNKEI
jgi:acetylornithine aminotransferase